MGLFWKKKKNETDISNEDHELRIELGTLENGVLELREGITKLDDESLDEYKHLRKIIFPSSLVEIEDGVIHHQPLLEELDFSRVTQVKKIPDNFIEGDTLIQNLVIPRGVLSVGDCFLGECKAGVSVFIPDSVKELERINGDRENNVFVYLFAPNVDLCNVEEDVKCFYVPSEYYFSYAEQLKECESKAMLRDMPEEVKGTY